MIVTVTLNPSLDRTVEVDALTRGVVHRAHATHLHPGGKGVNVTRVLLAHGVPGRAVLPVAGPEGDQLVTLLAADGVPSVVVPVTGRTRSNVTIAERDGTVTKLNEPGAALTPGELDDVLARALDGVAPGAWAVLCGSLPPGVPADGYATMTHALRDAGLAVAVDTSGPALGHAVAAGPDLVKPNADELASAVGRPLRDLADVVAAATELRERGACRVLVSLGADGAVLVDDGGVLAGECVPAEARSTVGAGDAFLAGFLAELVAPLPGAAAPGAAGAGTTTADARTRALHRALTWGVAAVRLPGSQMPEPAHVRATDARVLLDDELSPRLTRPLSTPARPDQGAAHGAAPSPSSTQSEVTSWHEGVQR